MVYLKCFDLKFIEGSIYLKSTSDKIVIYELSFKIKLVVLA